MRDDWNSSEFATDLLMRGAARRKRESLLGRACAGLTLPENVPDGALTRLVEAALPAMSLLSGEADDATNSADHQVFSKASGDLRAALRDLGIGDTK